MTTEAKPKMNTYQSTYADAKALYETIKDQRDEAYKPLFAAHKAGQLTNEALIDRQCDVDRDLHLWEAFDVLRQAEELLIGWAKDEIKAAYPGQYEQIAPAFQKPIYSLKLHNKLVDLCFRLQPKGID